MTMVLEPPAVRPAGRLTVEDLERLPGGDDGYELVEGVLVEKQMGALSSAVSMNLALILGPFCKTRQLGRIFDAECGYRLFPDRPDVVRKPDVSFVSLERLPRGGTPRGFFTLAPDLAAEVLSPRDLAADLDDKIADYLAAGVRQVWVL
ncbi:MAG: Uma2 family endonuclease, partial [Armatimonadetes bacterium]|nr:Uma2 family endonuclease [Armatimonadota bacterium]